MKLTKLKSATTQMLNVESKKEFTVDTSNQMIVSILRDKLYSNKVAAVCREVASNSRDANREAGKGDTPVIINISNDSSLLDLGVSISFKDSGIGISPSRIDNVFLKYGSSTKRDSNNQTGGFGIGAKTPFAYTNEFLISTVSEEGGKRLHNIYQAAISNEGGQEVSQLILVSSNLTNEQTGTEIIVPIKESDEKEFLSECLKATMLWETQPKLTLNGSDEMIEVSKLIEHKDFKVIYGAYNSDLFDAKQDRLILQIDGIPYRLKYSQLGRIDSEKYNYMSNSNLVEMEQRYYYDNIQRNTVLHFDTGELTMSASREDIEYTQENINQIFNKFTNAEKYIEKLIIDNFNAIDTTMGKISLYNTYTKSGGDNDKKWFSSSEEDKVLDFYTSYGAHKVVSAEHKEFSNYGNIKKMSENRINFFRIKSEERFSFTKKNIVDSIRPSKRFLEDNLFVIRFIGESNAYAKNLTLQKLTDEEGKSGIVFMTGIMLDNKGKFENYFIDLLTEYGVNVIKYADVERTKVQRGYSGSGVKKDVSLGTIYARKLNINQYYIDASKLKMEYNKKEGVMNDWDMRVVEEGETNVLIPVNAWTDLKDLDRTKLTSNLINSALRNEQNDVNEVNVKSGGKGEDLPLSFEKTCSALSKYGYRLVFVKNSELKKVENDKGAVVGLNKAFSKLLKDKRFITDVVNSARRSTLEEVAQYTKGSYTYDRLYKNSLKKKFLILADFNVDNFKTPMTNSLEDTQGDNIFGGAAMLELANRFSKKVKGRDYSKYMTAEKLEVAMNKIAKSHPVLHYLFEKCDTDRNWEFSDYNIESKKGNTEKEGVVVIREGFENLLNKELEKLKK